MTLTILDEGWPQHRIGVRVLAFSWLKYMKLFATLLRFELCHFKPLDAPENPANFVQAVLEKSSSSRTHLKTVGRTMVKKHPHSEATL